MKIRDTRSVEIVVRYVGRRDDGRSRTPAFCSDRAASLPGGSPALPKPIQQAPIHAAAVAGDPLPDALRGLDLSRSRSAVGRASRIAPGAGLVSVPDFTTLYRFLQRLDEVTIDRAVGETVRRLRGTHRKGRRRARVAVDATGLAQGAVSTFFVRRMHHHGQKPMPWRHWLKWVVVVDLDQQFLLSQIARRGPWNDCANLPAVVEAASEQTRIGLVLADAEFDSERNHTYIRKQLGAQSVIPAKRGKKTWRIHGVRAQMRRAFPRRLYRRRSLIESLFSSVKRKLSARAPGRSLRTQKRQALLLGLSFNLYRLRHR